MSVSFIFLGNYGIFYHEIYILNFIQAKKFSKIVSNYVCLYLRAIP